MLRTVSMVVAGSLLAAPASAAVMQAVFTGYETYRYSHDIDVIYHEDGSATDVKNDSSHENDLGTPVTWTLRYTTEPNPHGASLTEDSWDFEGYRQDQWSLAGEGVVFSSVLKWGDRTIEPLATFSYFQDSIVAWRTVDTVPGDGADYDLDYLNLWTDRRDQPAPGIQTTQYLGAQLQGDLFSAFGPIAEFTASFDPASPYSWWANWQTNTEGYFYDHEDGSLSRWTSLHESLQWSITSLTVTRLDGDPTQPAPVPLPASAPLLLAALGGTWAMRRRNRA